MKRVSITLFTIAFIFLSAVTVFAADRVYTEGLLQYTIREDGNISIVRYYGDDPEYTVPWRIGTREVKSIEAGAFTESSVNTVHLPDNNLSMAEGAFRNNQNTEMYGLSGGTNRVADSLPDGGNTIGTGGKMNSGEESGAETGGTQEPSETEHAQETGGASGTQRTGGNSSAGSGSVRSTEIDPFGGDASVRDDADAEVKQPSGDGYYKDVDIEIDEEEWDDDTLPAEYVEKILAENNSETKAGDAGAEIKADEEKAYINGPGSSETKSAAAVGDKYEGTIVSVIIIAAVIAIAAGVFCLTGRKKSHGDSDEN